MLIAVVYALVSNDHDIRERRIRQLKLRSDLDRSWSAEGALVVERMRTPVAPKEGERGNIQLLTEALKESPGPTPRLIGPDGETIELPESVFKVLFQVVEAMSRGLAVSVVPVEQDLTTQQAADLLNMSRQFLVQLLDQGRIPHHKTGKHRRIRFGDLMAFKEVRDRQRRESLRRLTRLNEEFGMYDDDLPTKDSGE
jgi:excisionase family DNA binding protein